MRSLVVLALLAFVLPVVAQEDPPQANPHSPAASANLVHGVDVFKAGRYEEATRDFQSAVDAEPTWRTARVYLATALSYQVVPNLETPENLAIANRALDQFNQLLASDPKDVASLRQVASIRRNVKRFDDALATYRKIISLDPNDAESHYTIGVIEWTDAYLFAVQTLADESLQDDGEGNARMNAASCSALISHNMPLINDGIAELTRAVEIRPTYDDAMSYLNLAYRRRADFDCTNAALRRQDLDTAGEWTRRAAEARRINEQPKPQQARDSGGK